MRKNSIIAIAVTAVLGIGAWWYWSPYIALHSMREALRTADADEFNDHVDYPKVRESLKGQLSALMTGEMMKHSDQGNAIEQAGSALGSMLGLALVDRMVDGFVRPEAVMQAMRNGRLKVGGAAGDDADQKIGAAKLDISTLSSALKLYKLDHGVYPTQAQGLEILVDPAGGPAVGKTYLDALPVDPWGRPYQYHNPGAKPGEVDVTHLPPPPHEAVPHEQEWHITRKGTDRLIVQGGTADGDGGKGQVGFVLKREGFAQWKLVEIRLPANRD